MYDAIIIGGGAGGIVCALQCALGGKKTLLIEAGERIGRKILVSGNGRCNLSNTAVGADKYNAPKFVAPVLESWGCNKVLDYFATLGLLCRTDGEGRVYPHSMSAGSVLNVLSDSLNNSGCNVLLNVKATDIVFSGGAYRVITDKGEFTARSLVLACGGIAGGGINSYGIVDKLGIPITPFTPALTYIKTPIFKGLKGVKAKIKARIKCGDTLKCCDGEILFRDDGISGIASFWMSTFIARYGSGEIELDFAPEYSLDKLLSVYGGKRADSLRGLLHKALSDRLIAICRSDKADDVIPMIKSFKFSPIGLGGMRDAQVTCGGLDLKRWDNKSLQSIDYPRLYCIGEMLDVDGECGGYNLHWAWASALAVSREITDD
ncbi:MAG: aminoacetone oxidase family FAD-binding enzyme [Clostridia bacterium]|nr:aminoacetone oxidase family FAD-binding enzyme [Clostridia bacterium]